MKLHRVLALALLALAIGAPAAGAVSIGLGAFGGLAEPILQGTSTQGTQFGVRVPVDVVPMITVEPYYAYSKLGDKDETFGGISYTRDGGKVSAFGANALFNFGGPGYKLFPFVGLGTHSLKREGLADESDVGYNFGLGLGFAPIPKLSVSLRGEFNMIGTGETSRKSANVTLGVAYTLFSVP